MSSWSRKFVGTEGKIIGKKVKIIGRKVFGRRIVFEKRKGWLGNIVRSFFSVEIRDNTRENLKR